MINKDINMDMVMDRSIIEVGFDINEHDSSRFARVETAGVSTYSIKWLINAMLPAIILSLVCAGAARAQDPIGSPNEIWITSPSGNTFYNGEEVELQIHVANEFYVTSTVFGFKLYSPDTSAWVWVEQPDGFGSRPWNGDTSKVITANENSRWIASFGLSGTGVHLLPVPLGSQLADTMIVGGWVAEPPGMAPGELEHTLSMHIRPTHTGTICIDSAFYVFPSDEWYFFGITTVRPDFNGPFCFTVVPGKGDVNCDGAGNVADAVYLINWIFKNGPEPCR